MNDVQRAQLFTSLAKGEPRLREFLSQRLSDAVKELVKSADTDMLLRAQGRARELQALIDLLDHYRNT